MIKTREILRLRWSQGLTVRQTSRATNCSTGIVSRTESRARAADLDWSSIEGLDDATLERRLYGGRKWSRDPSRPRPDPVWMALELRKKGVTLELLHLEYLRVHPDGLRYTQFCEDYRAWKKKTRLSMRQTHKAGERAFLDYSGKRPEVVDPATGEVREVELFVAVLGASNFTYAEATETQQLGDFIRSNVRTLEYFGGVPEMLVPDQLKSAVNIPDRYEPTINRTYRELGRHYQTAIVPARPRKPKDKAKVEVAVQVAQRWILARLRHETFYSIDALNRRIRELVDELNRRPMKHLGGQTRRGLFEMLDRPVLRPLPGTAFEPSEWKAARVAPDYHVAVDHHFYSVPHRLRGHEVEVRLTATMVEILFLNRVVATHVRSREKYRHTTNPGHMPEQHRTVFEGGERTRKWAEGVGPSTLAVVEAIFNAQPIEVQGWRSAQGLRRLESKYGPERLEAACSLGSSLGVRSYKTIERILRLNRDSSQLEQDELPTIKHDNIRGGQYYN